MTDNINKNQRLCGIDLLRIIATLMVITLHVLGLGGVLNNLSMNTYKYYMCWSIESLCYCAVDIFGLITGYFYVDKYISLKKIIKLWLVVVFYCVIISLFFLIRSPSKVNIISLIKSFLPVTFSKHWYFKSYFLLYLSVPFINKAINSFNAKILSTYIFIIFITCSIMQTIYMKTLFSFSILLYMYLIGAYIKKYENDYTIFRLDTMKYFLILVLATFISMIPRLLNFFVPNLKLGGGGLLRYHSPCMIVQAISLLLLFKRINIKNFLLKKVITIISGSCFSIYIVHMEEHIFNSFIENRFTATTELSTFIFLIRIHAIILLIFVTLFFTDLIRKYLFRFFMFDKLINVIYKLLKLNIFNNILFIDIENVK